MVAILEEQAVRERVPKYTVEKYHLLYEAGFIAEDMELIRGAVIEKMPKSPLHASIVTRLFKHLTLELPLGWLARSEQPITFAASDSEPEPDIVVVRGTEDDFDHAHPTTAEIIMEVVITSERLDRIKLGVYAEAGVPECWLILAEEKTIERHTQPEAGVYQLVERTHFPEVPLSTVLPSMSILPPAVFTSRSARP